MTDRSFESANDESRARLARLAARLTTAQLATDLGEGWTVASALAHMGFWERWPGGRGGGGQSGPRPRRRRASQFRPSPPRGGPRTQQPPPPSPRGRPPLSTLS